jgi:hypothetical protein
MTLYDLTNYVNHQIDDSFLSTEVAQWYNIGTANYNLIPPVTTYTFVPLDADESYGDLPITDDTFMLAVMLPFIVSSIKGQEAALSEKQFAMQEYMMNARTYKSTANIPLEYLKDKNNNDLELYQLGENVYLTDFTTSPMAGEWTNAASYKEVRFVTKDNTLYKVVDDSKVDEDWDEVIENG